MYEISLKMDDLEMYEKNAQLIETKATACGVSFIGIDDTMYLEQGIAYLDIGWITKPSLAIETMLIRSVSPLLKLSEETA